MAIRIPRGFTWNVLTPGGCIPSNPYMSHLETKTFTRRYTLGQGKALKFMTNNFLKKLGVNRYMQDLVINKTEAGQPGYPDTYRVRIRYK